MIINQLNFKNMTTMLAINFFQNETFWGNKVDGFWIFAFFFIIAVCAAYIDTYALYKARKAFVKTPNPTQIDRIFFEGRVMFWNQLFIPLRFTSGLLLVIMLGCSIYSGGLAIIDWLSIVAFVALLLCGRHKKRKLKQLKQIIRR